MLIQAKYYPKNRLWDEKVFSMPNIPRGDDGLLNVLREILTKVRNHDNPKDLLFFKGSESKITLDEACVRLRPMRLVVKTKTGWELTNDSSCWLDSGDDLYLAALLCANIRFVAEVLYYLDTPRKSSELKEIAIREYGMGWKTLSDVNSRLVWLRQFGLVDYQEFSMLYSITEKGKTFLQNVQVVDPHQITHQEDETFDEESITIGEWVKSYCKLDSKQLSTRRQTIGYILGNIVDFDVTISEYLLLIQSGTTYEGLRNYASKNHNIAASSVRSFMSALTNIGLIKRKTDNLYVLTETATKWLETCSTLELVCCLHRNFLFIFEMLNELDGKVMDYKELHAIGKVSYGLNKANIEEIRKRIAVFKSAKLVRNVSIDKYTITKRGQLLLKEFEIQNRKIIDKTPDIPTVSQADQYSELFAELRVASKDSANPDRFEHALKTAFELLGFKSTKFGGAGKTDILIQSPGSTKVSFSVAVDAKSTASSSVSTGMVDFDSLKDHRRKHHANFSLVVGCAFQNESLIKRAIEHNVVLLDIDSLENLIRQHIKVPLKLSSYKQIFEKPGIADISLIKSNRQEIINYGQLMQAVMNCLIEESDDPITEGFLFERDIYRSLRNSSKLDEPPTIEAITSMLQFLSSPLIGCVERTKDGYYATGSLADASRKFSFYSQSCSTFN